MKQLFFFLRTDIFVKEIILIITYLLSQCHFFTVFVCPWVSDCSYLSRVSLNVFLIFPTCVFKPLCVLVLGWFAPSHDIALVLEYGNSYIIRCLCLVSPHLPEFSYPLNPGCILTELFQHLCLPAPVSACEKRHLYLQF